MKGRHSAAVVNTVVFRPRGSSSDPGASGFVSKYYFQRIYRDFKF